MNTAELHKVAVFCIRTKGDLLVFEHDGGGVQIPAGTVEPGEEIAAAAIRELAEESGVVVTKVEHLYSFEERGDADERVVAAYVPLLAEPNASAAVRKPSMWRTWVRIRENVGDYSRVALEKLDFDRDPPLRLVTNEGYVLSSTLRHSQQRHIFRADAPPTAPADSWKILGDDEHIFRCYWAPLDKTGLVTGHREWLDRARPMLRTK